MNRYRYYILPFFLFAIQFTQAQKAENIIIVTTDGFRRQEVYGGMDSAIANSPKFNEGDSAYIFKKYWADDKKEPNY